MRLQSMSESGSGQAGAELETMIENLPLANHENLPPLPNPENLPPLPNHGLVHDQFLLDIHEQYMETFW